MMATGTKIRLFAKWLDRSDAPFWVISPAGRIAYLSAGCADWLRVDINELVDRQAIAGAPVSDNLFDRIAASLSPPPGIAARGTASLKIQPPGTADHRPESMEVRFVRVGRGDAALTLAVAGDFVDRETDHDLQNAVAIRQRLDAWRNQHSTIAAIASVGDSDGARIVRRRLTVATQTRTDIALIGPPGSGTDSIANLIHQRSAPAEPVVTVDGSLMDAELLEATMSMAIHPLSESPEARATAIIGGLDEMPWDAQHRLAELWTAFDGRLRLIGLCSPQAAAITDSPAHPATPDESAFAEPTLTQGLHAALIEALSALTISIVPLAQRAADIPLIATAVLDQLRSRRETSVERINRAALDAMVNYPWPRNFEELSLAVRSAARRASGPAISTEHLPLAIRSYRSGDNPAANKQRRVSLDHAVANFESRLIEEAIEAAAGNRAEAARRLGISRARLLRKLDDRSPGEGGG